MRLPALAALLAIGIACPATAAVDLGPIGYGVENRIVVPVEVLAVGEYSEEFTFTVTGAPRDKAKFGLLARSSTPNSFDHQELGVQFFSGFSSVQMNAGGPRFDFDPRGSTTFRLFGEISALPASYDLQIAITPLPATALLLTSVLAALGLVARNGRPRARQG